MAKKAAKSGGAAPSRRQDASEEARLARLVAPAIAKQRAGERLSREDVRSLKNWEEFQLAKYGKSYFEAIPKKDVSAFTGRQSKSLLEFATRYGLPYERHASTVDGRAWFAFVCDLLAAKGRILAGNGSAEDSILQLATGPLKDELVRKLIEKNELANEKARIELMRLREEYVPVEPIRQFHNEIAGLVAELRESFSRLDSISGHEAAEEIADLAQRFEQLAIEHFGDGSSSANTKAA